MSMGFDKVLKIMPLGVFFISGVAAASTTVYFCQRRNQQVSPAETKTP